VKHPAGAAGEICDFGQDRAPEVQLGGGVVDEIQEPIGALVGKIQGTTIVFDNTIVFVAGQEGLLLQPPRGADLWGGPHTLATLHRQPRGGRGPPTDPSVNYSITLCLTQVGDAPAAPLVLIPVLGWP
jgi:hypothetical protein